MPRIRLCIVVTDGERLLVDLANGRELPGVEVAAGDIREDEEILAEAAPALTGLAMEGFRFLESVPVRRGAGSLVNLYVASEVVGALPVQFPPGLGWAEIDDLERSAIPDEVLAALERVLAAGPAAGTTAGELSGSWGSGFGGE